MKLEQGVESRTMVGGDRSERRCGSRTAESEPAQRVAAGSVREQQFVLSSRIRPSC